MKQLRQIAAAPTIALRATDRARRRAVCGSTIPLRDKKASATDVLTGSLAATQLGVTVDTLSPALASRLGSDAVQQGVVATGVEPGGLAQRTALRRREIIVAIDDNTISNPQELQEQLSKPDFRRGIRLQVTP